MVLGSHLVLVGERSGGVSRYASLGLQKWVPLLTPICHTFYRVCYGPRVCIYTIYALGPIPLGTPYTSRYCPFTGIQNRAISCTHFRSQNPEICHNSMPFLRVLYSYPSNALPRIGALWDPILGSHIHPQTYDIDNTLYMAISEDLQNGTLWRTHF